MQRLAFQMRFSDLKEILCWNASSRSLWLQQHDIQLSKNCRSVALKKLVVKLEGPSPVPARSATQRPLSAWNVGASRTILRQQNTSQSPLLLRPTPERLPLSASRLYIRASHNKQYLSPISPKAKISWCPHSAARPLDGLLMSLGVFTPYDLYWRNVTPQYTVDSNWTMAASRAAVVSYSC